MVIQESPQELIEHPVGCRWMDLGRCAIVAGRTSPDRSAQLPWQSNAGAIRQEAARQTTAQLSEPSPNGLPGGIRARALVGFMPIRNSTVRSIVLASCVTQTRSIATVLDRSERDIQASRDLDVGLGIHEEGEAARLALIVGQLAQGFAEMPTRFGALKAVGDSVRRFSSWPTSASFISRTARRRRRWSRDRDRGPPKVVHETPPLQELEQPIRNGLAQSLLASWLFRDFISLVY